MLLKGDCIEVMKAMKPNSVDAIVTDPPYGLEFMGKCIGIEKEEEYLEIAKRRAAHWRSRPKQLEII